MLPVALVEADFLAVVAAEEPAAVVDAGEAAELAAGAEVVAAALLEAAGDFAPLVFAAVASGVPAADEEDAAGVALALADFLLLLVFLALVVSDEPAVPAEGEVWSAAPLPEDFFLLDFDLPELAEVSAPLAVELPVVSDFAFLLDFLLEVFVSLGAAD